jgi:hypothetical protein
LRAIESKVHTKPVLTSCRLEWNLLDLIRSLRDTQTGSSDGIYVILQKSTSIHVNLHRLVTIEKSTGLGVSIVVKFNRSTKIVIDPVTSQ